MRSNIYATANLRNGAGQVMMDSTKAGVNRRAPIASLVLFENHDLIAAFSRIDRTVEPRDAGSAH